MTFKPTQIAAALLLTLLPFALAPQARAQGGGGAGSRGGMVRACFDQRPAGSSFVEKTEQQGFETWHWPALRPGESRDAYGERLRNAAAHLIYVELDEYADVLNDHQGTDNEYDVEHRMHPIFYLLREAARAPLYDLNQRKRRGFDWPVVIRDGDLFSDAYFDLTAEDIASRPAFQRLYQMVVEMLKPVPGFYMRLKAAHDKLGWVHDFIGADQSGIIDESPDFLNVPKGRGGDNCVWMKAVTRNPNPTGNLASLKYDPFLWRRMDIFQRVLLQLHEELYYLGSDARKLRLFHPDATNARSLLAQFLWGQRDGFRGIVGYFASKCATYELPLLANIPGTILTGPGPDCPGWTVPVPGSPLRPREIPAAEARKLAASLICYSGRDCQPLGVWKDNIAKYGPYTPAGLVELIERNEFGRYHTIEYLQHEKDRVYGWLKSAPTFEVPALMDTYNHVYNYCKVAGYGTIVDRTRLDRKSTGYLARRTPFADRSRRIDRSKTPKPGWLKAEEVEQARREDDALAVLKRTYNHIDRSPLADADMNLTIDYPESNFKAIARNTFRKLEGELRSLSSSATPDHLEPGIGITAVCDDVWKRRETLLELDQFLSGLTFYEPTWDANHPSLLEAPLPDEGR